ncbi:MAG: transposase, partial [Actinomycetes bacterium]
MTTSSFSRDDARGVWRRCRQIETFSTSAERTWPPQALFEALLLAVWSELSDIKLAEALDDRASFRRFCGFAAHESTPERTPFVRFRKAPVAKGLDRQRFDEIIRPLDGRGIVVKAAPWSTRRSSPRRASPRTVRPAGSAVADVNRSTATRLMSRPMSGMARMRWLGLAEAALQVRLTAIAFAIRRAGRI